MNVNEIITQLTQALPENWLNQYSKTIGFCKRKTSKFTPFEYLRLMVTQASSIRKLSLNDCCNILTNINPEAQMQPQSLWERINSKVSVNFLQGIYEKISGMQFKMYQDNNSYPAAFKPFSSVIIEDSTCVSLNEKLSFLYRGAGGSASKAGIKLHTTFNPLSGECKVLDIYGATKTDNSLSDYILRTLKPSSLIIRDLGFFNQRVFREIEEKGAFFLSRLTPSVNVYANKNDKEAIDLPRLMSKRYKHFNHADIMVFLGNKERLPVRLIIYRAPEEVANERRRKAKSKGRALKPEYSKWLSYTYFITNATEELIPGNVAGTLYGIRWQIELIYKVWKSLLKLDRLDGFKVERILSLLYAKLISIVFMSNLYQAAMTFAKSHLGRELSMTKYVKRMLDDECLIGLLLGNNERILKHFQERNLKSLCKQKRKRKTTFEMIIHEVSFGVK